MNTISIFSLKGGTGKTISAVNIAHILACPHNKRVLLIDNDKQGNASQYFKLYDKERSGTAAALMTPAPDIDGLIYQTEYSGLDIITANMDLYEADRQLYETGDIYAMRDALETVADDYDYCVIDCPPSIDTTVLAALVASNDVLIPVRADDFSFKGLEELEEQLQNARSANPALSIKGCFFTHWQNTAVNVQGEELLRSSTKVPVFQTHIPYNQKIAECTFAKMPVAVYSRRSWAAIQYVKLVSEYLAK